MPDSVVEVEGASELARLLRRLGDVELKQANRKAFLLGAAVVSTRAKSTAPVGQTGRLQQSVRAGATQTVGYVQAGNAVVKYAATEQWGRKQGNVGSPPGNHPGPNPVTGTGWMTRAADDSAGTVAAIYEAEVLKVFGQLRTR